MKTTFSTFKVPVIEKTDEKKYISYSQYSKWAKCPMSWKLCYIDKIKKYESSIHAVFGTAIHSCIQYWVKVIYTQTIKNGDALDFTHLLRTEFKAAYTEECERSGQSISTKEEIAEFFQDGIEILNWIRKNRKKYFDVKNEELIGIELPICLPPDEKKPSVILLGYIDLILKDKRTGIYIIRDIKTSGKGWNDYDKRDEVKISQLLLYKKYFSVQYGIPMDNIKVEYFIVKRKIDENSAFPQRRVQQFEPSQGKISLSKAMKSFDSFVSECFTPDGNYNTGIDYPAKAGQYDRNCRFCEFNNETDCPSANRKSL